MQVDEGGQWLEGVFEELEQRAEGLHLAERDSEVADRARREYASVTLASRVHASIGRPVTLRLAGGTVVEGSVLRAGTDWCLVGERAAERPFPDECVVRLGAIEAGSGLSSRALPEAARPAVARLGLGSVLRHLAEERSEVVIESLGGGRYAGHVLRVGCDFTELAPPRGAGDGSTVLVAHAGIAAVRRRRP